MFEHFEREQVIERCPREFRKLVDNQDLLAEWREVPPHELAAILAEIVACAGEAALKEQAGHVAGTGTHLHESAGRPVPADVVDATLAKNQLRMFFHGRCIALMGSGMR